MSKSNISLAIYIYADLRLFVRRHFLSLHHRFPSLFPAAADVMFQLLALQICRQSGLTPAAGVLIRVWRCCLPIGVGVMQYF